MPMIRKINEIKKTQTRVFFFSLVGDVKNIQSYRTYVQMQQSFMSVFSFCHGLTSDTARIGNYYA